MKSKNYFSFCVIGDGYTGKVRKEKIDLIEKFDWIFQTTLCIVYKDGEYPQDPYVPTIFENYAGKRKEKNEISIE